MSKGHAYFIVSRHITVIDGLEPPRRGGLTGSIRPEDPEDLTFPHLERDVGDSDEGAISLLEPFDFDDVGHTDPHNRQGARAPAAELRASSTC